MRVKEFENITLPVAEWFWKQGYFTIPLPKRTKRKAGRTKRKEFALDMPAFKKFDLIAMKSRGEKVDVRAVESKENPEEAIPQARVYQLLIPYVYVASEKEPDDKLLEKLSKYNLGYIAVTNHKPAVKKTPEKSRFFNESAYNELVLPRVLTVLAFYKFMKNCLNKTREEEILEKNEIMDLGVRENLLWISDKVASEGIQWSAVCGPLGSDAHTKDLIRFGINLESVEVIRRIRKKNLEDVFIRLRRLPRDFYILFQRRCEEGKRFKPGMKHVKFRSLGWDIKRVSELEDKEVDEIIRIVRKDDWVELGIWGKICESEKAKSFSVDKICQRMKRFKRKYLNEFYEELEQKES